MRGKWQLADWELESWKRKLNMFIVQLSRGAKEINLTERDINPYQVETVLEELGWEEIDMPDTNGWEQDRWNEFRHPNYPDKVLIVFSCGITFELKIYFKEEE